MPNDQSRPPVAATAAGESTNSQLRERVRSLQLPALEERRSPPWKWIVIVLLLAGGAYAASQSGMFSNSDQSADSTAATDTKTADETPRSTPVATTETTPAAKGRSLTSRAGIVLESPGYITPAHRILVSPKVSGMLIKLNIEEGERVKKDDILGVIESIEYEADVQRAKALLDVATQKWTELDAGMREEEKEQARAEYEEAVARLDQMTNEYERATKLSKVGGVSQTELDEAKATLAAQKFRIQRLNYALTLMLKGARQERRDLAKAEVSQAEAELRKAQWRLDNCTIRSPISGTILKKNAEEGNIVNPIAFNGSFSVCEMADLADLEVDLTIQERDIAKVFKGQRCKVRANAYQDRVYDGYVDRLMPIADRAKGAVPVRVKVSVPPEEEGVYLKPDMSAVVTFYAKSDNAATAKND